MQGSMSEHSEEIPVAGMSHTSSYSTRGGGLSRLSDQVAPDVT